MEIRKFIPDQPPIDRRGKVGIRILEGSKEKKTELSEAERMEQERKDYFDFSGDCGRSAYAELTNDEDGIKYPHLENTVKHGALYFGHTNFKPENPVNHPTEYIDAFKKFIEQSQEDVAKADPIKPEEIEEMIKKNFYYTSSVDGNDYNLTAENWPYHNFKGKKENYESRIKEAKTTLKEFGEAAMEAGDNKTYELVQNVLKTLETDEGKDDKVININDIRQAA